MIAPGSIAAAESELFAFGLSNAFDLAARVGGLSKTEAWAFARWLVHRFADRDVRDMMRTGAGDLFALYRAQQREERIDERYRLVCRWRVLNHKPHLHREELRKLDEQIEELARLIAASRPA